MHDPKIATKEGLCNRSQEMNNRNLEDAGRTSTTESRESPVQVVTR